MSSPDPAPNPVSEPKKARRYTNSSLRHPVHKRFHGKSAPLGIRMANLITGAMGSWTFLIVQTVMVFLWLAMNVMATVYRFDPYPFILLNLAFSVQAAYAAPLILMAGNVAAAKDRELWENDYCTNQEAYSKILDLERQIKSLAVQNQLLLTHLAVPQPKGNA
jgi:uncharacterized membrane protein